MSDPAMHDDDPAGGPGDDHTVTDEPMRRVREADLETEGDDVFEASAVDEGFEELLRYLRDGRGFDFTGYKRTSLSRRVRKRMAEVGIEDYGGYLDHVQVHPEEVADLFDTILINVTAFRRDPEHWEHLRTEVLPRIVADTEVGGPIRVWSAGCSTGEEAYTLAMEFCELLGVEEFKHRVKIYATDVDGDALQHARRGQYESRHLEELPQDWVDRYFEPSGSRHVFRRDIRRAVIFGRHDIVQDAPISRVDLLVCRNLLMYFQPETQTRILSRLHFGLQDAGFLFLGRAEMLLTRSNLFEPVDLAHRVFRKSPETVGARRTPRPGAKLTLPDVQSRSIRLRDLSFVAAPVAQLVLDRDGTVALANRAAREMFGLEPDSIGTPFGDLEMSYRPVELRGHLDDAQREERQIRLSNVARVDLDGDVQHLDIGLVPLRDPAGAHAGMLLTFEDVTEFERLRADLQRSNHDLETAYEELQSTNEELLTTNEELQSTIEELETTNEELQSTNEELETMNEELQSSNLEQEEINNELNTRTRELDRSNEFLRTILEALDSGVVVVDEDLRVQVWDATSADTWGLQPEEVVGVELEGLECGLPVAGLVPLVQQVVTDQVEVREELPAVNRVGREVTCHVHAVPLRPETAYRGALLIVSTQPAP